MVRPPASVRSAEAVAGMTSVSVGYIPVGVAEGVAVNAGLLLTSTVNVRTIF